MSRDPQNSAARVNLSAIHYAALLEEDFSIPLLLSLGFCGADLDAAFDQGILQETAPGVAQFADQELRRRKIEELSWSAQRQARLAIAKAMQAHSLPCFKVAEQLLAAHAYEQAREILVASADKACAARDFQSALECLQKALELWPRGAESAERRRVEFLLGRCARNCAQADIERAAWQSFIEDSPEDEAAPERAEAYAALADLAQMEGRLLDVLECLKASAASADLSADHSLRARRWMALASFHTDRLKMTDAASAIAVARQAAKKAENMVLLSEVVGVEGLIAAIRDEPDKATELVQLSMELALQTGQPEAIALAQRRFGNIADYASDFVAERDFHLKTIQYCETIGEEYGVRSCKSCLSYTLMRTGDWPRALKVAEEVFNDSTASEELRDLAELMWSLVRVFRGELKSVEPRIDKVLRSMRKHGILVAEFFALWLRAMFESQSGRPTEAAAAYEEVLALWSDTEDRTGATIVLLFGAICFARQRNRTLLLTVLDALNLMSGDGTNRERRGATRAVRAEVYNLDGDYEQACQMMAAAVADYNTIESMPEWGVLRWRYGEMLLHAGQTARAHSEWEEGEKLARRLGWRHLCGVIEASRAAAMHYQETISVPDAAVSPLTQRQCEVLSLIASGLSNKEAASRLSLSPRTVEMHVARIIERLNCRTRTEAISRASQAGWLQQIR